MMSDRPFTEEDMKNDGLFKSELQGTMRQVASRENSEIYQLFTVVCDGVAPPEVKLADAAIRALNDDAFSERLEGVEVEVRSVKRAMNREEDLEYVQNLFERFGLGNNNSDLEDMLMDQIKKLVDQAQASDPSQFTYWVNSSGRMTANSRRQWNERAKVCIGSLRAAEQRLHKIGEIAEEYPGLAAFDRIEYSKEELEEIERRIALIRKHIQAGGI